MKFMLMLKADAANQQDRMPSEEELNSMGRFNEKLIEAGVLLAGEGLHPVQSGSSVEFDGDERTVSDGPFTESKEFIAGFWILDVASKEEAMTWARGIPLTEGTVEVRQVHGVEEFDQANEYVQQEVTWREENDPRTA